MGYYSSGTIIVRINSGEEAEQVRAIIEWHLGADWDIHVSDEDVIAEIVDARNMDDAEMFDAAEEISAKFGLTSEIFYSSEYSDVEREHNFVGPDAAARYADLAFIRFAGVLRRFRDMDRQIFEDKLSSSGLSEPEQRQLRSLVFDD